LPAGGRRRGRGAGLESSLELPEQLKDHWFPAEFSASLTPGKMVPFELFGQTWVLFRDERGGAACVRDECAHRACPLSLGSVVDGRIRCAYHGWEFEGDGACTKMPSTAFCRGISVDSLPVSEADGLIWVWPGSPTAATTAPPPVARPPPGFEVRSMCGSRHQAATACGGTSVLCCRACLAPLPPSTHYPPSSRSPLCAPPAPTHTQVHAELVMEVPVEHGLLLENLLDLAHAPFTHTSTFAKGWPVPDVVRFNASQLLGGNWEPYPIDMQFGPPCLVLSTIGLTSPGRIERGARAASCRNHLHQLHVCLPSSEGRTRLLYRMSLDFMHWTKAIPGIHRFWQSIAEQVRPVPAWPPPSLHTTRPPCSLQRLDLHQPSLRCQPLPRSLPCCAVQVLGEDLVLVRGQQDRMARGGDVWGNPVSYDKLGVRYRRWRNSVASGNAAARQQAESSLAQPLSAGEVFQPTSEATGSDAL
jgi:chlorophyllide a oxygenase